VKAKLIVKAHADLDIAGHFLHLLGKNPVAARRFREAVKAAQKRIKQDPRGCATLALREFEDLELRFCRPSGFDNYLLIFQVTDEGPILLRVLHGSQDVPQALRGGS